MKRPVLFLLGARPGHGRKRGVGKIANSLNMRSSWLAAQGNQAKGRLWLGHEVLLWFAAVVTGKRHQSERAST